MVPLIVYIYQSDYLPASSVVVFAQVPDEVRVRQDVWVCLFPPPPQRTNFSRLWPYLLSGRSAS